jgi:hypothetical protein
MKLKNRKNVKLLEKSIKNLMNDIEVGKIATIAN